MRRSRRATAASNQNHTMIAISWLQVAPQMAGPHGIVMVESSARSSADRARDALYITRWPRAERSAMHPRALGIENGLHWVMDMVFRDDECRIRKDNAPANFTTLKHMASNLVRGPRARTACASNAKPPPGTTTSSQASSHRKVHPFPWAKPRAGNYSLSRDPSTG